MLSKDRQYRNFDFETKEMRIEGVAIVFEKLTKMFEYDGIEFYEIISKDALDSAEMSDVVLNIDHEGKPAAKTKNGTLQLKINDNGLFISADLSKNATGRELHEDIKNGFYDKMSFAFTVREESYDKKTRTRRIEKIDRLFDVSAVTFPAYNQTTINARSFFEAEAQRELMEVRKREELKKRLRLKLELERSIK